MLDLKIVPTTHIQQSWDDVEQLLASAMEHSAGEYDINQLKVMLTKGTQTLLVGVNSENKIKCALTIEWINYPNDRVAFITAIGGRTCKNSWNQFIEWVKINGGTKIQGAAYESVARLWKRSYGFENRYIIVERKV